MATGNEAAGEHPPGWGFRLARGRHHFGPSVRPHGSAIWPLPPCASQNISSGTRSAIGSS
jgi:hypothetical protein